MATDSPRELTFIQTILIEDYTADNLDFPCALCDNCHIILTKRLVDESTVLPQVNNYDPKRPLILRDTHATVKFAKDC